MWRIQWPDATPGSTQSVRCPGEGDVPGLGLAHRNCLNGGVWGSVDASNCESVAIRDIRIQVGAVMCIEQDKVTVSYIALCMYVCMPNVEMCYISTTFNCLYKNYSITECHNEFI